MRGRRSCGCSKVANRLFGDNIVPNGDSSTRNLAGADVEVKSGGYQHCLSRQGTLSGVKVRTRNDDRVRSLQRSDLLSVVAARDISLQSRFCAPTRALQAGQIQVKQNERRARRRSGVYYSSSSNKHVASDCDRAVWITNTALRRNRDATLSVGIVVMLAMLVAVGPSVQAQTSQTDDDTD